MGMPINLAVFGRQMLIRHVIIGFVNDQATRIRMMAEYGSASRCRKKRLRQLWAGRIVIQDGRENAGLEAADDSRRVRRIHQPLCNQSLNNGVLLRFRQVLAVLETGIRILQCVEGFFSELVVLKAGRL